MLSGQPAVYQLTVLVDIDLNNKQIKVSQLTVSSYLSVQVHLATLNGQKVVVKVQRPGLKQLFDIDLKNVRVLAQWLQNVDPKSDGAARDWVAIYDECSRILYQVRTRLCPH